MKRAILSTLTLFLVTLFLSQPIQAQSLRAGETFYVRQHFGIANYLGDNEKSPFNFNGDAFDFRSKLPVALGAEAGYQFSPQVSLGAAYQLGQYPLLFQEGQRIEPFEETNTLRHTGALMFRYTPMAEQWRVAPYAELGANASYSRADILQEQWAYGPSVGLGIDAQLTSRTSLLFGYAAHTSLDDNAIDLNDDNGFGSLDVLGAMTVGFKHNFRRPFVPVAISAIDGPATLLTGEQGLFTATVNVDEATTPITFTWTFDDGTTAEGLVARHTYVTPGSYTVKLTADNGQSTDTETLTVVVERPMVPATITSLSASVNEADTQTPITFNATVMGDTPMIYAWTFGDGVTSSDKSPMHTFPKAGNYNVTLTVGNEAGSDTETLTIPVVIYEPPFCSEIVDMNVAYFEHNSSALTEAGREALRDNAEVLSQCNGLRVSVSGMAAPSELKPLALALARAETVRAFYNQNGVTDNRIDAIAVPAPEGVTYKVDSSQYRKAVTAPIRDM